jgi:hypothetical protein
MDVVSGLTEIVVQATASWPEGCGVLSVQRNVYHQDWIKV